MLKLPGGPKRDSPSPPPPNEEEIKIPVFVPKRKIRKKTPIRTIPRYLEDVSVDYLNFKLSGFGKIKSFKIESMDVKGYVSNVERVLLNYEEKNGKNSPESIVVKMTGKNVLYKTRFAHKTEIHTLRFLKGDEIIPKIFFRDFDEKSSEFILLMEDLKPEKMYNTVTMQQAKLVLSTLAKFQCRRGFIFNDEYPQKGNFPYFYRDYFFNLGLFYLNKRKEDECFYSKENEKEFMKVFKRHYESVNFSKEEMEFLKKINATKKMEESFQILFFKAPKVIVHGDFRLDNIIFKEGEEKVYFIDWQLSCVGSPSVDFVNFVVFNDIKDIDFNVLMKYYHSNLNEDVRKNFKLKDFAECVKASLFFCLFYFLTQFKKGSIENLKEIRRKIYDKVLKGKGKLFDYLRIIIEL